MKLTVRAMTARPSHNPWMSDPVEIDVPADTPVAEAFRAAAIGKVLPDVFNDWEWWEPWLRRPSGEWFDWFGIPWSLSGEGHLVWEPDAAVVSVGELRRSIDEGVLQADRSCIHFWAVEGLGGGDGLELLERWPDFREWLALLADLREVGGWAVALAMVVRAKWRTLARRGAKPQSFIDFILSQKENGHDSRQLAKLLSMEHEQARCMLVALGFVESDNICGYFVFAPNPHALEFLRLIEGVRGYQAEEVLPPEVMDRLWADELSDTSDP